MKDILKSIKQGLQDIVVPEMSVKVIKDSEMEKIPSKTQWNRVRKMQDHEIDYVGNPPLDEAFFEEAVVWKGVKKQITLRIDPDVIDFFRKQGTGYQTVINDVLRKYVEAQKKHAPMERSEAVLKDGCLLL